MELMKKFRCYQNLRQSLIYNSPESFFFSYFFSFPIDLSFRFPRVQGEAIFSNNILHELLTSLQLVWLCYRLFNGVTLKVKKELERVIKNIIF